jgi:hypothetical protein
MLTTAYDAPVWSRSALVCLSMLAIAWSAASGGIRADIDGDGRPDAVSLTRSTHFFTLRVVTGNRVITKVVHGFSGQKPSGIGDPRLMALRPMNARRGLEIEVEVWHGAANAFFVFYALDHGQLVAMTGGPHDPADTDYVWDVGGTAGTGMAQVDCVRRGQVGVLAEWTHRGVWHYRETVYVVRRTRFVKAEVYELASERMVERLPADWPKVRRLDFTSCGGVVPRG